MTLKTRWSHQGENRHERLAALVRALGPHRADASAGTALPEAALTR